jgi:hypothetical protein
MIGAVSAFYDEEKDSFTTFLPIVTLFIDVKTIYKEIGLNELVITEGIKGKVAAKDISQEEIIKTALVFAGAIYGYAVAQNNAELQTFADVNSYSFTKLRDSEVPLLVEKILDKADEIGDALSSYNITEDKKTSARSNLNSYLEKYGSVSTGRGTKKTARETNQMLFTKADKKLKVLDKLVLGIKESNSELYSKYDAARVIYDKAASRKTAEEIKTTSAAGTSTTP